MPNSALDLRIAQVAAPVRQQLVDTLRRAILELRFRPGDRLVERKLCDLTGVSRTSLREALRQLESEGLVAIVPNRGPIVAIVDREEARQIYDLRALLEGFMGRRFTERATDEQIKKLTGALEAFRKAVKRGEPKDLISTKNRFYELLMEGSGNKALDGALRNLHGRVTLLRATSMSSPGRISKTLEELEAIMISISARDPEAAERACSQHVASAAKVALEMIGDSDWLSRGNV